MKLLFAILRKDPDRREDVITVTSVLSITVNFFLALLKIAVGLAASSIAIISEAVNNATDAITSVIAIIGSRLSGRLPDEKHPFGYGRIEHLASLVISVLILVSAAELLISSVKLIFSPSELTITNATILIIAVSAVVKYLLGVYMINTGRRIDSGSLIAVGTECRNDSFASAITIVSIVIFRVFNVSVDSYAGIITSVIILKAGGEVLLDTVADLIGRRGKKELADELYREIRSTPGIENAADMMLHSYGPDSYSGSVNVEMDRGLTAGEIYAVLHKLQLKIMHEKKVTMVFGVYAVDNSSEAGRALRSCIADFVRVRDTVRSFHAVYCDEAEKLIYCDFVVEYGLRAPEKLRAEFTSYIGEKYPGYGVELTVETDYV